MYFVVCLFTEFSMQLCMDKRDLQGAGRISKEPKKNWEGKWKNTGILHFLCFIYFNNFPFILFSPLKPHHRLVENIFRHFWRRQTSTLCAQALRLEGLQNGKPSKDLLFRKWSIQNPPIICMTGDICVVYITLQPSGMASCIPCIDILLGTGSTIASREKNVRKDSTVGDMGKPGVSPVQGVPTV